VNDVTVRAACIADLSSLLQIYNHYVRNSYATFDERQATLEERRTWFSEYREAGPFRLLVAEREGEVIGYASSSPYRSHPAFRSTVETSIYLAPEAVGAGVGRALYTELFSALSSEPVHRALAGIALPNPASVALHHRFGFRRVGVFHEYASKGGTRVSSVWMEKAMDAAW
jgi:phosphinothricin acetyltransferase